MKQLLTLLFIGVTSLYAQTIPSYVPTNGLVGWWPFNGNANDESGNGNNGIVNGGATLAPDRSGVSQSAYQFDGVDDFISATPALPNEASPRSVSCWFYTSTDSILTSQYPHLQTITGWGDPFSGPVIFPQFIIAPTGKAYFESGSGANQVYSQLSLNNGNWHHIVTTYSGPNTSVKMYINGILQDSTALITLNTSNSYFGIGNVSFANVPFNGLLDDVGLWNRALSPQEILALFNTAGVGYYESNFDSPLVAPNPTNGLVSLNTVVLGTYELLTLDGRILESGTAKEDYDLTKYPKGVYHLRLTTDEGTRVLKVVKN
jgi:hypothetical protein